MSSNHYVGRLAPSPTGAQHIGNARTFLVAWLMCRQANGRLWLRIEDLDTPRTKIGAAEQAVDDLRWLGLDWDRFEDNEEYTLQSHREPAYREILERLKRWELVYPCTCKRGEIDAASSAPHESALDGQVYSGTCAHRRSGDAQEFDQQGIKYAWRFRMPSGLRRWRDERLGEQVLDAKKLLGDFVVGRNYGGTAYQLAVVVDDHAQGVNHVVRGDDLIYSTYRQSAIYEALGWPEPSWLHLPLVVGPDGKRLAKRHGDSRLATYRDQGVRSEQVVGYLAHSLGLVEQNVVVNPRELLGRLGSDSSWIRRVPESPLVFVETAWR